MAALFRLPSFAFALVALLALQAPSSAQNLIVNADAEVGSLAGWTAVSGTGLKTSNSAVYAGLLSFTGGITGPGGAYMQESAQTISLAAYTAMIDAGSAVSVFSCAGRSNAASGVSDPGRVRLEFLSASNTILSSYDTGVFSPFNVWNTYSDVRVLPAGVRNVRVRMTVSRPGGASTDAFIDALDLRIEAAAAPYCTAKINSQGCLPTIHGTGAAKLSASTLVIGAGDVINQKAGLLFYGFTPTATPFQGGTLCIAAPTVRTPIQQSGGSVSGADCTGAYTYAWTSAALTAAGFTVGQVVYCQYWSRDPASASTTGLTAAVRFRVAP
jgi:hypothetical protein